LFGRLNWLAPHHHACLCRRSLYPPHTAMRDQVRGMARLGTWGDWSQLQQQINLFFSAYSFSIVKKYSVSLSRNNKP
jgi:hypothetical protein